MSLEEVAERINRHFRFQLWNLALDPKKVSKLGISSYSELINFLVRSYGHGVGRPDARFWVDHTPTNVRFAATLSKLFPEAKFIHIVRDGRAVASSIKGLAWGQKNILLLSRLWVEKVGYGLAAESYLGSAKCLRVRYEELTTETERVVRDICSFTGLAFEEQMLSGRGFAVPKYTVKQHALVGKRPNPQRVNAWEKSLSQRDVEIFEYMSGDLLEYLGYTPKFGLKAERPYLPERLFLFLKDVLWHKPIDRMKERRKRKKAIAQLRSQGSSQ